MYALRTVSGCGNPARKGLWIMAGKIMLGKGKMLSANASHSFIISALLTHSPAKVDSVFISICFPVSRKEIRYLPYMEGRGGAALKRLPHRLR